MNKAEQEVIEQALILLNNMEKSAGMGDTAQIRYTAHQLGAIAVAMANGRPLEKQITDYRRFYKEAVRTERDRGKAEKRKGLGVIDGDKK